MARVWFALAEREETRPEVEQAFSRLGVQARPVSPDEIASYLAREQQHWGRIIETTQVSVD
jgi:hypothetical protein